MQSVLFGGNSDVETRNLSILKVRPGHPLVTLLGAAEPVWLSTHWLRRQYFCGGNECPMCPGHAARTKGFLPIWSISNERARAALLEITPHAWERMLFSARFAEHEVKAGRAIEATRTKSRGPLLMETRETVRQVPTTFEDPTYLLGAVALIHGIQGPAEDEDLDSWSKRTELARCTLLESAINGN